MMPETNAAKRRVRIGPHPFNWRRHLLRQAIGEAIPFAVYFGVGNKSLAKPGILHMLSACRNASPVRAERRRRRERMKERTEPLKFSADNLGGRVRRGNFLFESAVTH